MLKLYNTETKEKQEITPEKEVLKMYTCGPTVYNFAHIGNFRTYVFEDLLRRTIQYFGIKIEQAMNITDLDDKTIQGAIENKIPLKQFTDPFKDAFFEDLETLCIQRVEHYPRATDFIPQMIEMIESLIEKGFAYKGKMGSIYFSIRKFQSYGRLSHLNLKELKINASGDNPADEYDKDNICDFVLWKAFEPERDGGIFWESPFGKGRPGWHIECSAMALNILGDTIDIHCGGVDNMFPHHENEIAQSECCTGKHFVHHWVHVEHLLVEHKKMSKSLGNFYTLRDLLQKGYSGEEVRYLLLSTHYRTQLNFTFDGLEAARSSLRRISDLLVRVRAVKEDAPQMGLALRYRVQFQEALADDMNISSALAALFDLVRELNTLCDQEKLGKKEAIEVLDLFAEWNRVLACLPVESQEMKIPSDMLDLLEKREQARKEKNWSLSDSLRDEIMGHGYVIEDTPKGARLKKR